MVGGRPEKLCSAQEMSALVAEHRDQCAQEVPNEQGGVDDPLNLVVGEIHADAQGGAQTGGNDHHGGHAEQRDTRAHREHRQLRVIPEDRLTDLGHAPATLDRFEHHRVLTRPNVRGTR